MLFLDTCILIDYFKDKTSLDFTEDYCISSIVKRELKKINRILAQIKILETNQVILDLADKLIEHYTLSHNIAIYDAIIATTCLVYDLPLWTYNKKDFKFINAMVLI